MNQPITIPQAIELALRHHQSGRLQEAEGIYRQVLAVEADQSDALYLLGTLAGQTGHLPEAIELLRRAVKVNQSAGQYRINLGQILTRAGHLDEAEQTLLSAIQLAPQSAEAHSNLGIVLRRKGDNTRAIDEFRLALKLRPELAEIWNSLGDALQATGQDQSAIEAFHEAAKLLPNFPDAFYNLGNAMSRKAQWSDAAAFYRKAIALNPYYVQAMSNLAMALQREQKLDEAAAQLQRAIAIRPDFAEGWSNLSSVLYESAQMQPALSAAQKALSLQSEYAEAHNNAANALRALGQLDESEQAYRKSIALRPDYAIAHNGLATLLIDRGKIDEGIAAYRNAISLQPDYAPAHYNLALALLVQGDFENGWREHEWRARLPGRQFPNFAKPLWDGSNLAGQRILLHAEQGFGDVIQFARFVSLVKQRGAGEIILLCNPELTQLLRSLDESTVIVARGDSIPEYDVQCPLMSVPHMLGTRLDSIPSSVPYLRADRSIAATWLERIESAGEKKFNVGLTWAGHPQFANDRNRSIPPDLLAALGEIDGVRWFSLQKDKTGKLPDIDLMDWTAEFTDFSQTAGLVENLDLVISVDTSVAHLAGAMGKRAWTLIPFSPDWRWLLDREDSPWYPTMKLFRQPRIGDWETVIERIVGETRELVRRVPL